MDKTLRLLTGCTAAGKTALALEWAERFGAEILSCDSMLFYRGMTIGTAKPTPEEQARVPHHMIDLVAAGETFSVGRYVPLARDAVEEILGRGKRILVVGGSGFYLKSFFEPVVDEVAVDAGTRERVMRVKREGGLKRMTEELLRLNPEGVGTLDLANPKRVARALERCWASGRTLLELQAAFRRQPIPFAGFDKRVTVLDRHPAELNRRIETRARQMIERGLIDEVRRLREAGIERNPAAARAIGYRETLAWLDAPNPGSTEDLVAEIAANTRKLVKKQRTWFRGQLSEARWLSGEEASAEVLF